MPAPVLIDVLIEAALVALVSGGTFNVITYDQNGVPSSSATTLAPKEIVAYPTSSRFEIDPTNGMVLRQRRSEWTWALVALWESRVSVAPFERTMIQSQHLIAADEANKIPQVELRFSRAAYNVLPRGASNLTPSLNATFQPGKAAMRASWVVQAVLSPDFYT